ncbi:MAG: hypothetical protein B6U69_03340 [Thermofilum sp. ex4484_15]|nr:MAG: hypothetical protein B6U69_03340 [Thermofilum sp. ex4484_15]
MKLILAEKPRVAARIARILGARPARKFSVTYFVGKGFVIAPASGHLVQYDYPEEVNRAWDYPAILPLESLVLRPVEGKGKYLKLLKTLSCKVKEVIVATDLDAEGSAIGLELAKYLGWRRLLRAEFSSLSPNELKKALVRLKDFDYPRAFAGIVRQVLDLEWGANLTRALTRAGRRAGLGFLLSVGRVQTPTLKLVVDREREIRSFKPVPYYTAEAVFKSSTGLFKAMAGPFKEKPKLPKPASIGLAEVSIKLSKVLPPPPFNGTDLQTIVARLTGLSPRAIADRSRGIAQRLYEEGYISYIGTSSRKWPKDWGSRDFRDMVELISHYPPLSSLAHWILGNMRDRPVEGRVDDPAHPAIHVTGAPKRLIGPYSKVYELIARRCLAALAPNCLQRNWKVTIAVGGLKFEVTGVEILKEGWRKVWPYNSPKSVTPPVGDGEEVMLISVKLFRKFTKPPPRYTPISLIKKMEELGLGTKNTRPVIIDLLRKRGYVIIRRGRIRPTPLGETIIDLLLKYIPEITSPSITAKMEKALEEIERGELNFKDFLYNALSELKVLATELKVKERLISSRLADISFGEIRNKN